MAIAIHRYTDDWIPSVKAFNRRLAARGITPEFHFPESNLPDWLPMVRDSRIYQEYFLATEDGEVRGGFILKYQDFSLKGETRQVAFYRLPVSEGIVDKAYASVGVMMLRSAMKMQPTLFALGMGGFDRPLPTMLKAMGWSMSAVPFYFRIHHPAAFLRQITSLRQSSGRRILAEVAAVTGGGWLTIKGLHWIRTKSASSAIQAEPVATFGVWSDHLWRQCSARYALIADRCRNTLNTLYPAHKNFVRLRVGCGSEILGWAVVLDTQMRDNKYFANLRVGSLVDCLASPENAHAVVHAATRVLERRGVDLVIANHSHAAWGDAFRSAGYLQGPSNFIFAASRPLAEKLTPFEANRSQVYLVRGDGDGPVNL
jgi:hypothetical protein